MMEVRSNLAVNLFDPLVLVLKNVSGFYRYSVAQNFVWLVDCFVY